MELIFGRRAGQLRSPALLSEKCRAAKLQGKDFRTKLKSKGRNPHMFFTVDQKIDEINTEMGKLFLMPRRRLLNF